ncbi:signal peptidase II [Mycoplasma sp. 480]|uniref:signal peptidase II n=1 Tax=Mycoplasma sp. 480 TaxID=3440155 RepID=UPI003F51217C
MDKINIFFKNWKTKILSFNKKRLIINALITFGVLLVLTLIDQLTKNLIFEHQYFQERAEWIDGKTLYNYGFIGFRPLLHRGVTSGLNKYLGFTLIHIFSLLIVIVVPYFMVFSKKYYTLVFLGFLWAGTFGNMLDRFINQNGVKDILFLPWHDNGTFNFADTFIVIGSIGSTIILLYTSLIEPYFNKKKNINNKNDFTNNSNSGENQTLDSNKSEEKENPEN